MSSANERSGAQRALVRLLQREQKLSTADAQRIEELVQSEGVAVAELLEREGLISEKDLAVLLATTLRLRLIDLTSYPLDPQVARELKETIAVRYEVVPIRLEGGTIDVAIANPLDLEALKAVEFATGKRVQPLVTTRQEVQDALAHAYRLQESLEQFLQHVPDDQVTLSELHDDGADLRTVAREAELPPVVKLADLILVEGIKSRASDVHVEPATDAVAVRYRIDGILEESFRFPKWVQNALIARLKVMAKLDITERRVPQDGRIQLRYQERVVDLRVSSLPAQHGEKITLRILDSTASTHTLERLGLGAGDLQRLRDAIRRPEGMILITGPTGSGKTTTLYALLREKLSPNINIVTIENPIEYQLKGINQVEVNEKQGLTFAGVLRSVLRQDPDVILVGEIRDQETAQIAFQAAQTGHLVLSTVHTNDAAAAVTRLIDLGTESFVVASALHLVVAQRLVRRVCQSCGEPYTPGEDGMRLMRLSADAKGFRRGAGCSACRQSGFSGRTGVYEVLPISPAIAKIIEGGGTESTIRQQARAEGSRPLADDAREKLMAGVTTVEELLRVVQVSDQVPRCPGCGQDVADDYTRCPHCATVLRATCESCGKPLSHQWAGCPYCGAQTVTPEAGATAAAAVRDRTYKALVVDDNPAIRDIVRLTLERARLGLSVIMAEDGREALERITVDRPDVVILDLQMPDIDGFEVCRRLRSDVRTAFIPVLMLTAQSGEEAKTKGFAAGADDYMTKPFRRDDLLVRVRRMLERTYGRGAAGAGPAPRPAGEAVRAAPDHAAAEVEEPANTPASDATPAVDDAASAVDDAAPVTPAAAASGPPAPQWGRTREGVESMVAQLAAERMALSTSIMRCQADLAELTSRFDAEAARRAELSAQVSAAVEGQLAEIRRTVEQIRAEHERALADLRERAGRGRSRRGAAGSEADD